MAPASIGIHIATCLVLLTYFSYAHVGAENVVNHEEQLKFITAKLSSNYGKNRDQVMNEASWSQSVRPGCARDMRVIDAAKQDPINYTQWILPFINADARGTYPDVPGVFLGNLEATGSYEQCNRIMPSGDNVYSINVTNGIPIYVGKHNFKTHYCKARYYKVNDQVGFSEGWCVPETCDSNDVWEIMQEDKLKANSSIDTSLLPTHSAYCGEKTQLRSNPGAIVAMSITAFFIALVAVATLVDGFYTWYMSNTAGTAVMDVPENHQMVETGKVNAAFDSEVEAKGGASQLADELSQSKVDHGKDIEVKQVPNEETTASSFSEQKKPSQVTDNGLYRALVSFSLLRTIPLVVETGGTRSTFGCMNGMRVVVMSWIVFGHVWSIYLKNTTTPFVSNLQIWHELHKERLGNRIARSAWFGVEAFFAIGAVLVTCSFLKTLKRLDDKGVLDWVKELALYVFHRYWSGWEQDMSSLVSLVAPEKGLTGRQKLTPLLAAVMMIWINLWQYFGDGPNFPKEFNDFKRCRQYWWINLLYIQNMPSADGSNMLRCMGWMWYLANDFQYYLIAPVFITALYKRPIVGYILLGLAWCGTTTARVVVAIKVQNGQANEFQDLYIRPWTHFGTYAQGILLGYVIYRTKCKLRMHRLLVLLGWMAAIALALAVTFAPWDKPGWTKAGRITWDILRRDMFGASMIWTVFACVHGYGGYMNSFLGWSFWNPISKLTYSCYLIHPMIHFMSFASRYQLVYVQDITMVYQYIGTLVLTVVCSFGLTLIFEVPFGELERVIIPRGKKKQG